MTKKRLLWIIMLLLVVLLTISGILYYVIKNQKTSDFEYFSVRNVKIDSVTDYRPGIRHFLTSFDLPRRLTGKTDDGEFNLFTELGNTEAFLKEFGGIATTYEYVHCNAPYRDSDHDGGLIYFKRALGNFHTSDYHEDSFYDSSLNCGYFYINGRLEKPFKGVVETLGLGSVEKEVLIPESVCKKKDNVIGEIKEHRALGTYKWVLTKNNFKLLQQQVSTLEKELTALRKELNSLKVGLTKKGDS